MRIHTIRTATSVFGLIGLAALATPAMAQAESDEASVSNEIVVTAQRRAERSVDVPISVTTLAADTLATANVQDLSDISRVTPSLRFDNTGAFAQPTIRGVGTANTTSGGGANVGIYIDGFYSPNPLAADSQLMNVRSVQVLKGPQGTLFGRNTTGGAILIQSADPSEETSAQFKASYGRFNEARVQGYATTGIAEGIAVDIEGMYRRGDGWVTNILDGNDNVGKFENWSVRAGVKVEFGPASLLLRYQHGDMNDPTSLMSASYNDPNLGLLTPVLGLPSAIYTIDPDEVALDRQTYFRTKSDVLQATFKVDLGFGDLASYTQYRSEDTDASQNLDNTGLTGADGFQLGLPVNSQTWSQELLLTSKAGPALQWTAGLFYFYNRDVWQTHVDTFAAPDGSNARLRLGGSGTTTESYAAFLDLTYEISPQLFVTAGARYAHDRVTDAYYNPRFSTVPSPLASISGDRVTPRVVVRYKPTDRSSIYASFTRGYKAALIDAGGTCQNASNIPTPQNPTGTGFLCNDVKPEKIDAYEVGFKHDDRRFGVELSAFYYDYKNLQVSLFLAGQANILNAAESKIYGLDGSIRYELFEGFQLTAGASWIHARYKDFDLAPIYLRDPATGLLDVALTALDDVTMQRTPEFTGNIGARYRTDLGGGQLQLSGNLYYTSEFFFGPSGVQFPQKAYEVLSARAQWTDPSETYTVAVWGDNLTNNRYLTAVQYNTVGMGANWSAPTTYGIELGVKF
ncbi:MAG: TonB-dependent receptor [Novosphingobium sp.]